MNSNAPANASAFVQLLFDAGLASSREVEVLAAARVDSLATLWALLRTYPSLGTIAGFGLPQLSNRLAQRFPVESQALAQAAIRGAELTPSVRFGAAAPEGASVQTGFEVPFPDTFVALAPDTAAAEVPAIDHRCSGTWPVRDQGRRGTCVAFASTACAERSLDCELDLSEQYLYWAIKERIGDYWPQADGTLLECAQRALGPEGLCKETLWPYDPTFDPTNVSHGGGGNPTVAARSDAGNRLSAGHRFRLGASSGNAAVLLSWLHSRQQPVAVSVPVFSDPTVPAQNNWTTFLGWDFGRVLDPPPTSVVDGGHAVCVTGFVPDQGEPRGGWFVFRNSWSTHWGSRLPAASYAAPEPGYGQLSASYVDQYLWEMLQL